ncbi:hypothetical protein IWX92DRAFT_370073 [Phyllosticta citricarpa]
MPPIFSMVFLLRTTFQLRLQRLYLALGCLQCTFQLVVLGARNTIVMAGGGCGKVREGLHLVLEARDQTDRAGRTRPRRLDGTTDVFAKFVAQLRAHAADMLVTNGRKRYGDSDVLCRLVRRKKELRCSVVQSVEESGRSCCCGGQTVDVSSARR